MSVSLTSLLRIICTYSDIDTILLCPHWILLISNTIDSIQTNFGVSRVSGNLDTYFSMKRGGVDHEEFEKYHLGVRGVLESSITLLPRNKSNETDGKVKGSYFGNDTKVPMWNRVIFTYPFVKKLGKTNVRKFKLQALENIWFIYWNSFSKL